MLSVNGAPTCTEPADLKTRFNNINHGLDYRTIFFTAGWNKDTFKTDFADLVFQGIDNTQAECPATFLKGNFPLMVRAACPWYLEKTFNQERYPKELYHAKSKCQTCIGSDGLQKCERIYHQIKTLKRSGCSNGVYQYEEQNEAIPVAFICAQQREVENGVRVTAPPADDDGPPPM